MMDFTRRKPTREMWHVDVWRGGERILSIGHNHLSGEDMTPERVETVRSAIQQLRSFIGEAAPCDDIAADFIQIAVLVSAFFEGDVAKAALWFRSPNPNFGNVSPQVLIRLGKAQTVLEFALDARSAETGAKPSRSEELVAAHSRIGELETDVAAHVTCLQAAGDHISELKAENRQLRTRVTELETLINNPQTEDFLEAVKIEAAHQRERWAAEGTAGKTDADWFWLIGYLAGKALSKPQKILHHIITTAAACLNWHLQKVGYRTNMRPGIAPPTGESE